jgi:hypothetical protein
MKKTLAYLRLFIITILLVNCSNDEENNDNSQNDFELTSETIVLQESNINNLINLDGDEIIFNNEDATINNLEINDIIVADKSANTPNGFLRRVVSLENINNEVKIITVDAKITDAIKNGSVSFNETINPNDVISVDTSGEELNRNSNFSNSEFSFEINRTFDLDGNPSTTNDKIKFEGDIDFNPSFEFDIDINNQNVDYFLFKLIFSNTTSLRVEYDYSIEQLGIEKTYVLKTVFLSPITVWIGSFPLVLSRRIVFVSGIDGEVRAQMVAEASNTYSTELGIEYIQGSGWQTIQNQNNNLDGSLTTQVELSLEGWVQPRLEMRPYGVNAARIFLAAKGGLKSEIIAQGNTLNASLDFTASFLGKAQMNIFSSSIIDYEQVFWSDEFPIWSDTFGNNTFDGNVILTSQQEVDDFTSNNYTSINGYLFIGEQGVTNDINDLSGFSNLVSINGDGVGNGLRIDNTLLNSLNGLESLEAINGGLSISNASNLSDISQLSEITSCGNLQVFNCDNLTNISGLQNLQTTGNISIVNNDNIQQINLTSLTQTNGTFELINNDGLLNLDALNNLQNINNLWITGHNQLGDFCGLNTLVSNNGIAGTYTVSGNLYNPTLQDLNNGNCN